MTVSIIAWALTGVLLGFLAGLVPGLHPNIVAAWIVGWWATGSIDSGCALALIVSMGVAHSFSNIVPSLLVGVPDESTSLIVLPVHRMALSGRAREALVLYSLGGRCSITLLVAFSWFLWLLVPIVYSLLRRVLWVVLFGACYWLVFSSRNRWHALVLLLASGLWGLGVSSMTLSSWKLLGPLLSGLFGLSTIIVAWSKSPARIECENRTFIEPGVVWHGSLAGLLGGLLAGLVPGIGCGECGAIATRLVSRESDRNRDARIVACMGSLGTIDVLASLLAIVLVGNPRSGIAIAANLVSGRGIESVLSGVGWCLFSCGLSCMLLVYFGSILLWTASRIEPRVLGFVGGSCIVLVSLALSGVLGLVVLGGSCLLGIACHAARVRKSVLMGCLLVPAFLFFY